MEYLSLKSERCSEFIWSQYQASSVDIQAKTLDLIAMAERQIIPLSSLKVEYFPVSFSRALEFSILKIWEFTSSLWREL